MALGLLLVSPGQAMVPEPARVEGEIGGAESPPSAAPADRAANPITPMTQLISEQESLALISPDLIQTVCVQLVLDRTHRQLMVLKDGELTHRFPAAVRHSGLGDTRRTPSRARKSVRADLGAPRDR
jgi:hypothetical protein